MTTYTEQFAGMTTGVLPTGWTERTGTTTNYSVENPADGEAEDDRAFTQDGTAETAGTSMLTYDAVDGDANRDNCETLVRFRIASDTDQQFHLWSRASGSAGNRTGYLLWFDAGSGLRIYQFVAEVGAIVTSGINMDSTASPWWFQTSADQNPSFFNYPADTWLYLRWRVNGVGATVTHSMKVWIDGFAEPTDWSHTATDTTAGRIVAAGWTGWGRGEFVTSNDTEIDYFSVGTNGDTPAVATSAELGAMRITQNQVSVAVGADDPPVRLTHNQVSVALVETDPTVRLSASYVQVVYSFTPPITPQSGPVLTTNT